MKSFLKVLPVFVAFYCMGFVDIVGTAVNYASKDFNLTNSTMQFLTSMIFIWFFVFSIPAGILQDRLGKKTMVIVALLITTLAMVMPFILYNYFVLMTGLALMGIGNTVIQVSLNPLLYNVSSERWETGGLYSLYMDVCRFSQVYGCILLLWKRARKRNNRQVLDPALNCLAIPIYF
ncbi:hypothetical protein ES705_45314 [subsurface metagenome]